MGDVEGISILGMISSSTTGSCKYVDNGNGCVVHSSYSIWESVPEKLERR
jgi:hypothetical protein